MNNDIFIITAPSGAGKTDLIHHMVKELANLVVCVSHTTRAKRRGEQDEKDYFFVSEEEFDRIDKHEGGFLEQAQVYSHRYGISNREFDRLRQQDKDVIIEVDWQGAQTVKQKFPQAIAIFILPPSIEQLVERLKHRGTDSDDIIEGRAKIFKQEIAKWNQFDYLVVNEEFNQACRDIDCIVTAQKLKTARQRHNLKELLNTLQ